MTSLSRSDNLFSCLGPLLGRTEGKREGGWIRQYQLMLRFLPVRNLSLYKKTDYVRCQGITGTSPAPSTLWSFLVNILSYSILIWSLVAPIAPEDIVCVSMCMYVCA